MEPKLNSVFPLLSEVTGIQRVKYQIEALSSSVFLCLKQTRKNMLIKKRKGILTHVLHGESLKALWQLKHANHSRTCAVSTCLREEGRHAELRHTGPLLGPE